MKTKVVEPKENGRITRFKRVINTLKSELNLDFKAIAEEMGLDESYFTRLRKSEHIPDSAMRKLVTAYPIVNEKYIWSGEGSMFTGSLKAINEVPNVLYTNTNAQIEPKRLKIYDLDENTGVLSLFNNETQVSRGVISFAGSDQCDFAVKLHGECMRGKIDNGGIASVKEIKDMEVIPPGHVYLIITQDLAMFRYIFLSPTGNKRYLLLRAHNREQFEDFEIRRDKILRLFIVKKIQNNES